MVLHDFLLLISQLSSSGLCNRIGSGLRITTAVFRENIVIRRDRAFYTSTIIIDVKSGLVPLKDIWEYKNSVR